MASVTLASLSIPQSMGYATLLNLASQYGLYASVVPPLVYVLMGSSREIVKWPGSCSIGVQKTNESEEYNSDG